MTEPIPPRSRDRLARHAAIAFGAALLIYAAAYWGMEHLRTRRGGWQVAFRSGADGCPLLVVQQPRLGIVDVSFSFPGHRVELAGGTNQSMVFDQPWTNVPFGRVVYLDTTFLPGSVVLDLFGHQIQLLPRVLLIDGRELPWRSGEAHRLP